MMKRTAMTARAPRDIESLTEDQIAEVDRVLAILRGLGRSRAAARDRCIDDIFDAPAFEKFYFAGDEEDV